MKGWHARHPVIHHGVKLENLAIFRRQRIHTGQCVSGRIQCEARVCVSVADANRTNKQNRRPPPAKWQWRIKNSTQNDTFRLWNSKGDLHLKRFTWNMLPDICQIERSHLQMCGEILEVSGPPFRNKKLSCKNSYVYIRKELGLAEAVRVLLVREREGS